jgi:hypothetical protein
MGKHPESILVDGERFDRDLGADHRSQKSGNPWTDHESLALAVHPVDVPQFEREARENGVPTEFNKETGMPKFTSNSHRKRYLRRCMPGVVDLNSYY